MPRPPRLKPLELVGIAVATGVGWGIVMALVAWLREGAEIVLLQAFILTPAWFFGRSTRQAATGALAGFALVAAAVYVYELLPMWGLEAAVRREVPDAAARDVEGFVGGLDADDIALFSTLAIGALIGFGGGLHGRAAHTPRAPLEPQPAPAPAPPPPPVPLWADYGRPQPPAIAQAEPAPAARPERPQPSHRGVPWGSAFLLAAFATDIALDRLFGMYTQPQGQVALVLALAGVVATIWLARRYALAMLVAGAVLAAGFAALQHAEYEARHHAERAVIR